MPRPVATIGEAGCSVSSVTAAGWNSLAEGLDLEVESEAVQVSDDARLQRPADLYAAKYDRPFTVRDGAFYGDGGRALVFEIAPTKAFGFGKG